MSAMTRRTFLKASSGAVGSCAFGATMAAELRSKGIDEARHKNGSITIIDGHLHLFEDQRFSSMRRPTATISRTA